MQTHKPTHGTEPETNTSLAGVESVRVFALLNYDRSNILHARNAVCNWDVCSLWIALETLLAQLTGLPVCVYVSQYAIL